MKLEAQKQSSHVTGGYFGLAHRNTRLAHDNRKLDAFIARFKHSLLFMPKLILADHMIVNSPNFRIAYHERSDFRDLIRPEYVEIAHFEQFKSGQSFTLDYLREFYRSKGRIVFHPNLPGKFRTNKLDSELASIEQSTARRSINASQRDPLFTHFVLEELKNQHLKIVLGDLYRAYLLAHEELCATNPILGIVHFDPEHNFPSDENIFDCMMHVSSVNVSKDELIRRFGNPIAHSHRAILTKVETMLLDGVQPILPPDLREYKTLVLRTANRESMDAREKELFSEPIGLSVSERKLSTLTSQQIGELRGIGKDYFDLVMHKGVGTVPFQTLVDTVRTYVHEIDRKLIERKTIKRPHSALEVLRKVSSDGALTTVISIIASVSFGHYHLLVPPAVKSSLEFISKKLEIFAAGRLAPDKSLISEAKATMLRYRETEALTQYD